METNKQLIEILEVNGIVLTEAQTIVTTFALSMQEANKLIAEAESVTVVDENDKEGMDKARSLRLSLSKIRTTSEKDRKGFKEESLKKGKAIDDMAKLVVKLIEPIETKLEDMEKMAIRNAVAKKEKALKERYDDRIARIQPYGGVVEGIHDIKNMTDEAFESILSLTMTSFKANEEKRLKDEEIKKKEEEEKRLEDERIRKENEALKESNRIKDEEIAEARRVASEKEKIEQARLREEKKDEDERLATEARLQKEKDEAVRKLQLAPDKEKILLFAETIRNIQMPTGLSDNCQRLVLVIGNQLLLISDELKKEVEKL